jgi:IS5 family transposase
MPKSRNYRVTNWSQYNRSLVQRGSLMVWVDEEVLRAWRYQGPRRPGAPVQYSDQAIQMALSLKAVYRLGLRGTQGLLESLFTLLKVDLEVPDFSTLSRRGRKLSVDLARSPKGRITHLVLDSTGLKVYGEGEWKVRQHGISKRRTWRKLHVAVNAEGHEIEAVTLTEAGGHDAHQAGPLLEQIAEPVETLSGDGGYDKRAVYQACAARQIQPVVPPQKNAKIWQHGNRRAPPLPRDEHLRRIRQVGRQAWKKESGYHRRSLAETCIFRLKTILGRHLASRELSRQKTEAAIRSRVLNKMTQLGMPQTVLIT